MLSRYKPNAKYGLSDKKEFKVYEKVFARMKTYQPWPAKILPQQFPGNSVNNMLKSCIVFFYGTHQMGKCPFADIYDYETNKERFKEMYLAGKPDPRIEKAYQQCNADDGSRDDFTEPYADEVLEFRSPLCQLWEKEQRKMESKKRRTRKSDDETQDEEVATQPRGYESQEDVEDFENTEDDVTADDDDDDDDYDTKSRSRSRLKRGRSRGRGRKRRARSRRKTTRGQSRPRSDSEYAPDDESQSGMMSNDDGDDLTGIVFKTENPAQLVIEYCLKDLDIHETNPRSLAKLEDAAANLIYRSSVVTVIMQDGSIIELPVRSKNSVGSLGGTITPAELSALMSRQDEFEKLKIKLENGNPIPPEYSSIILPQLTLEHQAELKAKRNKMEEFLAIEAELLYQEHKLRTLLTMAHMDFKSTFKAMDTIMLLDVRPLMLKKNPFLVSTIKMLQNYDVSKLKQRLSSTQHRALETQAERVRCSADFIMEMFSCLFEYHEDEMNFYRAFYLELVAFIKETRGVPVEDVMLLTD